MRHFDTKAQTSKEYLWRGGAATEHLFTQYMDAILASVVNLQR